MVLLSIRSHTCLILIMLLGVGCTQRSQPLSSEFSGGPATSSVPETVAPNVADGFHLMVVEDVAQDVSVDGTVDWRARNTSGYDARGHLVFLETLVDDQGDAVFDSRSTIHATLNQYGNVVHQSGELDYDNNGTVDSRSMLSTTVYDRRGNPLEQIAEYDYEADGIYDGQSIWLINAYDPRGRPLELVEESTVGSVVDRTTHTFTYASSNVVVVSEFDFAADGIIDVRWMQSTDVNPHGHIVEWVSEFTSTGDPPLRETRLTTAYNRQGNPLVQVAQADWSIDGTFESQATWTLGYNNRGDLAEKVVEYDLDADGSVNTRETTSYSYVGGVGQESLATSSGSSALFAAAARLRATRNRVPSRFELADVLRRGDNPPALTVLVPVAAR